MNINDEARRIANKYSEPDEKELLLAELRRLDRRVSEKPKIISLIVGITGTLILGLGMSLIMVWSMLIPGIIIGLIGIAIALSAFPVYNRIHKECKKQAAPKISELSRRITDEI